MRQRLIFILPVLFAAESFSKSNVHIKENFDFDWKFQLNNDASFATTRYDDISAKLLSSYNQPVQQVRYV
jgi:hypothetical protein